MGKNRIRNRLIGTFAWMILIPMVTFTFVFGQIYSKSMTGFVRDAAQQSVSRINENIDGKLRAYENFLRFVSRDLQVKEFLDASSGLGFNQQAVENMNSLLLGYRQSMPEAEALGLVRTDGTVFSDSMEAITRPDLFSSHWEESKARPDQILIFHELPGKSPFSTLKTKYADTVSICMAVQIGKEDRESGVIHMVLNYRFFEDAMQNIKPGQGGYFLITDKNGELVYSPVMATNPEPKDKSAYLTVHQTSAYTDWTTAGIVPLRNILQEITRVRNLIVAILLIMSVLLLVVVFFTSQAISKPIESLRNLMKKVEEGDLTIRFSDRGKDEIHDLGIGFNRMLGKTEALIRQVMEEQKSKRKAEIAILQSNIKPHFLYNTLDTIHWMSKKYKAYDIIQTVDALSTLFRILLSQGNELIKLEDEIKHVSSYLLIQKVRYDDILTYEIEVDPACLGLSVQKLILQPFVENAIYHGIKESGREGRIRIRISRELEPDRLVMKVSDDGIGIPPEKLKQLVSQLDDVAGDSGYGMKNVHQRLVLSYGPGYGVFLESEPEKGTTVTLMHPVLNGASKTVGQGRSEKLESNDC